MNDNLIDVIVADHRAMEQVFAELETGQGSPDHRRATADHVIAELVRHSVAEEQYMYPAARDMLPDGDSIVDHEIEEHAEAERVMKSLEGLDASRPEFDELVRTLIDDTRHHIKDEENDLLPRLRTACSDDQLEDLGARVLAAKEKAPTRPHPSAPDTPPANKILDTGIGVVDRMRDHLTGRTT